LLKQEEALKGECRNYRRQLAHHRQQRWYHQPPTYHRQQVSSNLSTNTDCIVENGAYHYNLSELNIHFQQTAKGQPAVIESSDAADTLGQCDYPKKKRYKFNKRVADTEAVSPLPSPAHRPSMYDSVRANYSLSA